MHVPYFLSLAGKESTCNAGDPSLIPGREDTLKMEWLPTPVVWPGEYHGLYNPWGYKESSSCHFHHIFLIHSSIDGYLCCFYMLPIVNNAAMNMGMQIFLWYLNFKFIVIAPGVRLLVYTILSFLTFWGNSIRFSKVDVPFYIPINSIQGFQFFKSL